MHRPADGSTGFPLRSASRHQQYRRVPRHSPRPCPDGTKGDYRQGNLQRQRECPAVGKKETMQDQVGAYSPDRTAPSDHSPRRELAPHPPGYHPYFEMGYQDLGRNPSRLRKEITEIYCKRMASAGAEAILKLNLTKIY